MESFQAAPRWDDRQRVMLASIIGFGQRDSITLFKPNDREPIRIGQGLALANKTIGSWQHRRNTRTHLVFVDHIGTDGQVTHPASPSAKLLSLLGRLIKV